MYYSGRLKNSMPKSISPSILFLFYPTSTDSKTPPQDLKKMQRTGGRKLPVSVRLRLIRDGGHEIVATRTWCS